MGQPYAYTISGHGGCCGLWRSWSDVLDLAGELDAFGDQAVRT
jgi:hypothetical protein